MTMTGQSYQELPPAKRSRVIFGAALRSLLITAILVALYHMLPLDEHAGVAVRRWWASWPSQLYDVAGQNHRRPTLSGCESSRDAASGRTLLPAGVHLDLLRDGNERPRRTSPSR
jgi:hypothetical protein